MRSSGFILFILLMACGQIVGRKPGAVEAGSEDTVFGKPVWTEPSSDVSPWESLTDHFFPLMRFAEVLDSMDYEADTGRFRELGGYQGLEDALTVLVDGRPAFVKPARLSPFRPGVWRDPKIFSERSRPVSAYFYCSKERSRWREDGVIEQWRFNSAAEADSAKRLLEAEYPMPYGNTHPYYATSDNKLFIFHTRTSGFSAKQGEIFRACQRMLEKGSKNAEKP